MHRWAQQSCTIVLCHQYAYVVESDWVYPVRQEMLSAFAGVCLWADRVW